MEALAPLLGGLGLIGVIAALLLGGVVLLILPIWAMLHCLVSERPGSTKLLIIIALLCTWGLGAIFYGLFASGSRPFRVFTVAAVLLPLLILMPSAAGLVTGTAIHGRAQAERERAELDALIEGFQPEEWTEGPLEPFVALQFTRTGGHANAATLAYFTADGPGSETARSVDTRIRQVAHDVVHDRYFALTDHEFGTITPSSGQFTAVEVDPTVGGFHWPKGLALDSKRGRVVVMTSHVTTELFTFDTRTSDWRRLPTSIRDLPLVGLAYSPEEDLLYAVEHRSSDPAIRRIHRFNPEGASLGAIELDPAVPLAPGDRDGLQLQFSSGRLIIMLPPGGAEFRPAAGLLAVRPGTGQVLVPAG